MFLPGVRVTWKTGPAFVRGWSIRVTGARNGRRTGAPVLLRSAGDDHSVDFAKVPGGELRVSVIGRRFQGTVTRNGRVLGTWQATGSGFTFTTSEGSITCVKASSATGSGSSQSGSGSSSDSTPPSPSDEG